MSRMTKILLILSVVAFVFAAASYAQSQDVDMVTCAVSGEKMKKSDLEKKHWQTAMAIIESTAEALEEEGLRNIFLNAAPVREIMEHAAR